MSPRLTQDKHKTKEMIHLKKFCVPLCNFVAKN
jgi:hypothetical protein